MLNVDGQDGIKKMTDWATTTVRSWQAGYYSRLNCATDTFLRTETRPCHAPLVSAAGRWVDRSVTGSISRIIVTLRYIENIDSISIYRIVSPAEISNFRYTGIDFLIYHLAEFSRVASRRREIFIETFIETFTDGESFNENFTTSWRHTWKFGKRITEFFIARKFRKILHYYLFVRISKTVISHREPYIFQSVKTYINKTLKKLDR